MGGAPGSARGLSASAFAWPIAWSVALAIALGPSSSSASAQEPAERAEPTTQRPFFDAFEAEHADSFELLGVSRGTLRSSSDDDPRARSEPVVLLRMRALREGCLRLHALATGGPEVRSIEVNVVPREAAIAVPWAAAASERVRASVGDVVLWPLPAASDARFLPPSSCSDDDPDQRLLLAGEWPARACELEGAAPASWALPASLELVALRCRFSSGGRSSAGLGAVRTVVERFARIRRAGRVQDDLTAVAAGAAREVVATHVTVRASASSSRPLRIVAYVPRQRRARVGDWVFERRDDVSAVDEDLEACLHHRDTRCRIVARPATP